MHLHFQDIPCVSALHLETTSSIYLAVLRMKDIHVKVLPSDCPVFKTTQSGTFSSIAIVSVDRFCQNAKTFFFKRGSSSGTQQSMLRLCEALICWLSEATRPVDIMGLV